MPGASDRFIVVPFDRRADVGCGHVTDATVAAEHLRLRYWQREVGQARFFNGIRSSQPDLADIAGNYLDSGGLFNLVVSDCELVGFCAVRNNGDSTGTLKRFAVLQRWHRRGAGTVLLAQTVNDATTAGLRSLQLVTGFDERAFDMYVRAGFVAVGCDADNHDHLMVLDLSGEQSPAVHICGRCARTGANT